MSDNTRRIVARIQRGEPVNHEEPRLQEYAVDCEPGATVLDVLRDIQRAIDPTLSFRWECRTGICGTCAVMVNGRPCLSCEARIETEHPITIEPLRGFVFVKDLVVDFSPSISKLQCLQPYLIPPSGDLPRVTKEEADRSKQFRRCIECFICCAATAETSAEQNDLDPVGIVKLARFATDPRDCGNRAALAAKAGLASFTENELQAASALCPKHIDIRLAQELLMSTNEEKSSEDSHSEPTHREAE